LATLCGPQAILPEAVMDEPISVLRQYIENQRSPS
jgi:hypothetical protein